jgi:hypothetical protein
VSIFVREGRIACRLRVEGALAREGFDPLHDDRRMREWGSIAKAVTAAVTPLPLIRPGRCDACSPPPGTDMRPRRHHPAPTPPPGPDTARPRRHGTFTPTRHGTTAASEPTRVPGAKGQSRRHHAASTLTRRLHAGPRPRRRHSTFTPTQHVHADTARPHRHSTFTQTQHGTTAASERRCSASRSREDHVRSPLGARPPRFDSFAPRPLNDQRQDALTPIIKRPGPTRGEASLTRGNPRARRAAHPPAA